MNHPTPPQVRLAIVKLFHEEGRSYADIARLLSIGEATVSRVLRQHRETGGVEPRAPGGGNFSPITGGVARALRALVEKLPDATVKEFASALRAQKTVKTSRSSVQRALKRMGYSRKKSASSP